MENFKSMSSIFVKSRYGQVYDPVAEKYLGKVVAFAREDEPVCYGVVERIIRDGIDNDFTPPNMACDVWVVVACPDSEKKPVVFKREKIPVRRVWLWDLQKIDENVLMHIQRYLKGKVIDNNSPQLIEKMSYSDTKSGYNKNKGGGT